MTLLFFASIFLVCNSSPDYKINHFLVYNCLIDSCPGSYICCLSLYNFGELSWLCLLCRFLDYSVLPEWVRHDQNILSTMRGYVFHVLIPVFLELYYNCNSLQFLGRNEVGTFCLLEQGCVFLFLSDGRANLLLWNSLKQDIFFEDDSLTFLMVTLKTMDTSFVY